MNCLIDYSLYPKFGCVCFFPSKLNEPFFDFYPDQAINDLRPRSGDIPTLNTGLAAQRRIGQCKRGFR